MAHTAQPLDVGHGVDNHGLLEIGSAPCDVGGLHKLHGHAFLQTGQAAAERDAVALGAVEIH